MPTKNVSCKPQTIVDTMEAIDNNEDKIVYVSNVLKTCAIKKPTKKKDKVKRKMSGYNCYLRHCAVEKSFPECLKERGWAKLSDKDKDKYKELAKKDCVV